MVDVFGFRPYGRGPYSALAPFGFAPLAPQPSDESANGNGQGPDVPDIIPVGRKRKLTLWCQNRDCGAPTAGTFYPLCQDCNARLTLGGPRIIIENGRKIVEPIVPGED